MKRVQKGQYGYIRFQKAWTAVRTALFLGISLALFLTGYFTTKPHTKANLLTVVAVLGCLPASKSFVNMIMFLKSRGCREELRHEMEVRAAGMRALYDLVFTTYNKTYTVPGLVIKGSTICGCAADAGMDAAACGKYLEEMLAKNGCKGCSVKIFPEQEKYLARLEQLGKLEAGREAPDGERAAAVLLSLAL